MSDKSLRMADLAFELVRLLTIFLMKLVYVLMIVASEPARLGDNPQTTENEEIPRSPVVNIRQFRDCRELGAWESSQGVKVKEVY